MGLKSPFKSAYAEGNLKGQTDEGHQNPCRTRSQTTRHRPPRPARPRRHRDPRGCGVTTTKPRWQQRLRADGGGKHASFPHFPTLAVHFRIFSVCRRDKMRPVLQDMGLGGLACEKD